MPADVLIVGSGPAGLAAGVAAGREGLSVVLLEKESIGGELVNRHTIENLPGSPDVSGTDLRSRMVEQLDTYDVSITLGAVEQIRGSAPFEVVTTEGTYEARTVIVASGGRPTELDVPGAAEYSGRGVFSCATCDGPLYADDTVAVSGSSDWALTDALYLTEYASKVIVIEENDRLAAGETLRKRVTEHPATDVRTATRIRAVDGDDVLQDLTLVDTTDGSASTEPVGGLYVQQGIEPNTEFFAELVSTTECGTVIVDQGLETDTSGLFVAGDARQSSPRTVATAIGDGTTACHSAVTYLDSLK